ncbi:DUF4331 domain-containing protein [Kribbella capetownensis]|uniref:DUF4331 domain-containing protein n=1 Tax=Kribbella capetownensis TaxID=1572659 RepID=A0A4R0JP15_9ACTN|nr:DUF4331 family protein [Kribbella capetownensis]TCC48993.1 DUF4331 domain-containing protein [Kribbella capetownensis]
MSDHISGPRALAEPIADITDVFAFPSPETPGNLVLVLNTLPFAPPDGRFSDGLIYRFRLRPLTPAGGPRGSAPFDVGTEELVFDCVFSDQSPEAGRQSGFCHTPAGDEVTFEVGDPEGGKGAGVRAFAGCRWDPFILDAPAALKTIATGKLAFTDPSAIFLDGKNVLSIVVELDCAQLLGRPDGLVGLVAETLTRGRLNIRIERTGRPEVKNLLLGPKQFDPVNRDLEIRDLYNMEDGFHLADGYLGAYRARLNANLAFWDGLDGTVDWPADEHGDHPLTNLVLADQLAIDIGKPYQEHGSFLEIEQAVLAGQEHRTCGGRALNDDAMDTFFTLLINAGNGEVIRDGVDRCSRPASSVFPYLSPANPSPPQPPEHV